MLLARLTSPGLALRMRVRRLTSDRRRVGFGPAIQPMKQRSSSARRIYEVAAWINAHDDRHCADVFVERERFRGYDVVVIVKHLHDIPIRHLRDAHRRGCRFVYSVGDLEHTDESLVAACRERLPWMSAIMLGSPAQRSLFADFAGPVAYVPTIPIAARHKTSYALGDTVRLHWEGYPRNVSTLDGFERVLADVAAASGREVELVLHTVPPDVALPARVRVEPWDPRRVDERRCASDIAIALKPLDDPYQQAKPPSKLLTYMGAAMPIVCMPSVSDALVIADGETALVARDHAGWVRHLVALIADEGLRRRLGTAARRHVIEHYGIERFVREHIALFDRVVGSR